MDVNVCVEKSTLRDAVRAALQNMPHEQAVEHVAEANMVAPEAVLEALAEQA